MAEYINVTRPDGKTLKVSRKHFERSLRGQGFTEGDAVEDTGDNTGKTYVAETTTKPKRKRKDTLTPEVVANGPSEEAK